MHNGTELYMEDGDSLRLRSGHYEIDTIRLMEMILSPNQIALDIGAHIGYFTMIMARRCKEVYAFEVEPRNCALLTKNIEFNMRLMKMANVTVRCVAVTDSDDWTQLYLCNKDVEGASGMHRIYPSKWCSDISISVPSIRLDSHLDKADFIKMDIEGSEYGALKGMENLLKNNNVKLIMEFHAPSIREYGVDPKDEYDFLTGLGYNVNLVCYEGFIPISYKELEETTNRIPALNVFCFKN